VMSIIAPLSSVTTAPSPFSPMVVPEPQPPAPAPAPAPVAVPDLATAKWFYRDPQGLVQGPFSSREMREWFESGYFVDALPVRAAHQCETTRVFSHVRLISTSFRVPIVCVTVCARACRLPVVMSRLRLHR
jgi:hypothetical protein